MRRLLALFAISILAISACSSSAGTWTPVSTPTPTTAPTIDISMTAVAYKALATDLNLRSDAIQTRLSAATDDAGIDAALNDFVAMIDDYKKGMAAITFPDSLKEDVAASMAAADTLETTVKKMAATPYKQWGTLTDTFKTQSAAMNVASTALRKDLGLPELTPKPTVAATPTAAGPLALVQGQTFHLTNTTGAAAMNITVDKVTFVSGYKGPSAAYDDKPIHGGVFVQIFVTYGALVDGMSYNPADWTLVEDGTEVVTVTASVLYGPKPKLIYGKLNAGKSASGWVVFEVPPSGKLGISYSLHAGQPIATYTVR